MGIESTPIFHYEGDSAGNSVVIGPYIEKTGSGRCLGERPIDAVDGSRCEEAAHGIRHFLFPPDQYIDRMEGARFFYLFSK
jgi:hypothetical protein